ncbi:MAG: HAMP domain-containing sensor histidine kinase [Gudongella sp.]|nr:HAMP domain-containing sensor histidine kinase [Gudongella sp.]
MTKISSKLIVLITVVIVLAVGSIWIYNSYFLEDNYFENRVDLLKNIANEVDNIYEIEDLDRLEIYFDEILVEKNISSGLSTFDGDSFYSSQFRMMARGPMHNRRILSDNYIKTILSNGEASTIIKQGNNSIEMLAYSKILTDGETILTLSLPLESIKKTVDIMQTQLINISIILLIITLSIGLFISRIFLKPIKKLNYAVNQISEGNMQQRVEITTKDEIGELSKNFNNMADKLSRVELLRKDLISNVSHDLRTPLGLIKGYAEMIRDIHSTDPKKMDEDLNIIIEEADRLSSMVNEILDSSQFQSGYIELKREDFDLVELVKSSWEKYKIDASRKEIAISLNYENDNVYINADPVRLQQVIENLISNALNFTIDEGRVDLNIIDKVDYIRVEIKDNGIGISEEDQKLIWDRFYRVDKANDNKKSSGIGLAIVKNILSAHGFEFGVQSKIGDGTTFFFNIPSKV